jgi:hypothetical protein
MKVLSIHFEGIFYGRQFFALRLRFAPVVCRKKEPFAANGLLPLSISFT